MPSSASNATDQLSAPSQEVSSSCSFQSSAEKPGTIQKELGSARLAPVDSGRKAWTFCASAFLLETFVWGFNNSYGVFQDYYSSHQPFENATPVAISAIGTTGLGFQYIEILFVILICQRYPDFMKLAMWVSLLCCCLSIVVSSFAQHIWQLVLLQGVLYGINAGVLYAPIIIWLPEWFVARRGLAGGIIFGGAGLGGSIFPLCIGKLLEAVGFRWTLRIWAATLFIFGAFALLGAQPRIPLPEDQSTRPRAPLIPRGLPMWKNPILLFMAVTTAFQALSFFPVALYISVYTSSLASHFSATIVLAAFNAASAVAFISFGHLSDRYSYSRIIMVSSLGSALATLTMWGFANSFGLVLGFAVLFGGLSGGFPGIWPAAATDIAGERTEQVSLVFGVFGVVKGVAAIVGPIIAGSLYHKSPNLQIYGSFGFKGVQIFVGTMAVITAAGGALVAIAGSRSAPLAWFQKSSKG